MVKERDFEAVKNKIFNFVLMCYSHFPVKNQQSTLKIRLCQQVTSPDWLTFSYFCVVIVDFDLFLPGKRP